MCFRLISWQNIVYVMLIKEKKCYIQIIDKEVEIVIYGLNMHVCIQYT